MRLGGFPVTAPCGKFSLTRFHPVFLNFHSYVFIIRKLCAPLVNSWPNGGEGEDRTESEMDEMVALESTYN